MILNIIFLLFLFLFHCNGIGGSKGAVRIEQDRSFTFILKTPPAPVLIKKALGLETASAKPNSVKVGKLTKAQVEEIAKTKLPDLNCTSLESAMSMVAGTARSMGVTVEE